MVRETFEKFLDMFAGENTKLLRSACFGGSSFMKGVLIKLFRKTSSDLTPEFVLFTKSSDDCTAMFDHSPSSRPHWQENDKGERKQLLRSFVVLLQRRFHCKSTIRASNRFERNKGDVFLRSPNKIGQ